MKKTFYSITFLIILLFQSPCTLAQSIVDELSDENVEAPELVTERVQRISASKRIFIITNENEGFGAGDFISFVTEGQLTARAIVAKLSDKRAGIKIIKIYSLNRWNKLRQGGEVQIIRGDDSFFGKKKKQLDEDTLAEGKINSEEDLFNETLLEDDLTLEDKGKRIIKPDNIVGAHYGRISGVGNNGESSSYSQLNVSWAYQIDDNIWGELLAGRNTIPDFPDAGLNTTVNNFTIRAKYTIRLPFDSYLKPYLGYQFLNVDSPNAGVQDDDPTRQVSEDRLNNEISLVNQLENSGIVFGASILKRLVPGWFVRADLGSDIINIGLSLEF